MRDTLKMYTMSMKDQAGIRCKVALMGPKDWALGNINYFLKKHLNNNGYETRVVDWGSAAAIQKGIDWCDVFIAEVHFFNRWGVHIEKYRAKKGLYVWHHLADIPLIPLGDKDTRWFTTKIKVSEEFKDNFFAITKANAESVKDYYGIDVDLLPVGTDNDYWSKRDVKKIKTIGHVSKPEHPCDEYELIKRPAMFQEMIDKSDLDGKVLNGKNFLLGSYIYSDVDAVVCTSTFEGLPTPLLECAMARIPFISTNVGIVPHHDAIKTFNTAEEALAIIEDLNSDPQKLKDYVDAVYDQVVSSSEWDDVIKKYYVPAIERIKEKSSLDKELVVSHYQEDLAWLDRIKGTKITVYTKSDNPTGREAIRMRNVGRIEHTIFSHIVNRYDSLADFTFFCQDHPFDHVPKFVERVNDFCPRSKNEAIRKKGGYWHWQMDGKMRTCRWDGWPDHGDAPLRADEVWDELFDEERGDSVTYTPAAHFCVSKEQVHMRPKEFYQKVIELSKGREWGPWELERVTWAIFDPDIKHKESPMSYKYLVKQCSGYKRILVAGPQRSGTTFTAKALAKSLGVQFIDESDNPGKFDCDSYVWQFASRAHTLHERYDYDLVIWMNRDKKEVEDSEKRIEWEWFDMHRTEYFAVFGKEAKEFDSNYDMKHHYWSSVQKDLIDAKVIEFNYSDLKDAPGYLEKEERKHFWNKQTC